VNGDKTSANAPFVSLKIISIPKTIKKLRSYEDLQESLHDSLELRPFGSRENFSDYYSHNDERLRFSDSVIFEKPKLKGELLGDEADESVALYIGLLCQGFHGLKSIYNADLTVRDHKFKVIEKEGITDHHVSRSLEVVYLYLHTLLKMYGNLSDDFDSEVSVDNIVTLCDDFLDQAYDDFNLLVALFETIPSSVLDMIFLDDIFSKLKSKDMSGLMNAYHRAHNYRSQHDFYRQVTGSETQSLDRYYVSNNSREMQVKSNKQFNEAKVYASAFAVDKWKKQPSVQVGAMARTIHFNFDHYPAEYGLKKAPAIKTIKGWIREFAPSDDCFKSGRPKN